MNIKEKLADILRDYRGADALEDENKSFDEMGFDSLDKVELLMKIEEEFDITFNDELKVENVSQLEEEIKKLIR